LKLKGRIPNAVLSEGEQKVIAIADFLAEMQLSQVNIGIIFYDPVTSLDEIRKSDIVERLVKEASNKQVVIFTHDLVFVSSLIGHCKETSTSFSCHWIEKIDGNQPGLIWLNNTPSFEKEYKTSGIAQGYHDEAKKLPPEIREYKIKNGFASLRTSYESFVVFGLFNGVVQRFDERVSIDSLGDVVFNDEIKEKVLDSFYQCCRYMEGHSHSDKYAYKKPSLENLNEEIQRFNQINKEIKEIKKKLKKGN
jgi:wobble nucleotide-excising tRNase